jgi:hypothetical protein
MEEPMYLDGRLPEGYVLLCTESGDAHSFVVQCLGPSVECPLCGRTALSVDLAASYYSRRRLDRFEDGRSSTVQAAVF